MSELLALLALILSLVALSRASAAQKQARYLTQRLAVLDTELRISMHRRAGVEVPSQPAPLTGQEAAPVPLDTTPGPSGAEAAAPGWPEDQPPTPPPAPPAALPRPRGPSLWGPQFSRARISLIGGVLVLGGLAFTLRALGAPAWTLLLAVFAFGGLLYFNARRVPWPVSGALRGLGYGVAALGVGSLSQRLPGAWGPGAVMLGLLGLSAALLFDALRRRELLLGALAVGGAALSTWMLTDDLGQWSIPAAGAVMLLAAVAVWQGRVVQGGAGQSNAGQRGAVQDAVASEGEDGELSPDAPASRRAALALTLGAAGFVPVGWFVASASHAEDGLRLGADRTAELAQVTLQLTGGPLSLLPWLAFSVLALSVPLALLSRQGPAQELEHGPRQEDRPDSLSLSAAWAILAPQVLVAAAVGGALGHGGLGNGGLGNGGLGNGGLGSGTLNAGALAGALLILAALLGAARLAWTRRTAEDLPLASAVAGSLTAGAAGVAGALALSVLGPRTEPLALAGVAAALLLVGLYGRSRFWLRVGALGLAFTALWGMLTTLDLALGATVFFARLPDLREALLGAAPAGLGLLAAWRLGRVGWATAPHAPNPPKVPAPMANGPVAHGPVAHGPEAGVPVEGPPLSTPRAAIRWTPTLLAGVCSAVLGLGLLAAGSAVLAAGVVAAAAALWTRPRGQTGENAPFWAAAPGLALGCLLLLFNVGSDTNMTPMLVLGVASALLAGAALLRAAPRTFADAAPRLLTEGAALTLLALGLAIAAQEWWPVLGVPGALVLLAVLSAPLRLTLNWSRMDILLGLGALILLSLITGNWPSGFATYLDRPALDRPALDGLLLDNPYQDRLLVPALGAALLAAAWWLTRTASGLRPLSTLTRPLGGLPPEAQPHAPVARALWLGGWALLVPLALGARLSLLPADLRPWLPGSSLALLAVGLVTAVGAHRAGATSWARTLWTVGLALIAGAGIKGALLDAAYFPNSSAGLGIAVLITGLSLLAVAILAPRPAAPAPEELTGPPLGDMPPPQNP